MPVGMSSDVGNSTRAVSLAWAVTVSSTCSPTNISIELIFDSTLCALTAVVCRQLSMSAHTIIHWWRMFRYLIISSRFI